MESGHPEGERGQTAGGNAAREPGKTATLDPGAAHGASHQNMNSILFHVILLAYLFATLGFWCYLGVRHRWFFQVAQGLVGLGLSLQTLLLGQRLVTQSWRVWGDVSGSLTLLAWALGVGYVLTWWRYRIEALGSFMIPLVFLAVAVSSVPVAAVMPLPSAFQQVLLIVHIVLAVLGYAALALTFCAGVMYLIQERQLKSKHPGVLYQRLPSLWVLDELNARALVLGLPLLTQGVITGSVWAKAVRGSYLNWSVTSLPILLAWALYVLLLGGRYRLGWQGKKAAFAAVTGFLLVLASYVVHTSSSPGS
jgi:ABC-type transport system involved in cytochrome c biogenesis permease subunit